MLLLYSDLCHQSAKTGLVLMSDKFHIITFYLLRLNRVLFVPVPQYLA